MLIIVLRFILQATITLILVCAVPWLVYECHRDRHNRRHYKE